MDRVDEIKVREGSIHADRPVLLTPEHHARLLLENFGDKATEFAEWLRSSGGAGAAALKYGFQFRRSVIEEHLIHASIETAGARVCAEVAASQENDPLSAVIRGVDDAWEVCLLKFTMDLVRSSGPGNAGDLRRHGLL
jgi:hypothetical protein